MKSYMKDEPKYWIFYGPISGIGTTWSAIVRTYL